MALTDDIALLEKVALFNELGEERLRLIAFGAERRRMKDGEILFRENTPADCAFVVAAGSYALSRTRRDGSHEDLGTAGKGTLLGELAMITPVNRSMTAIAAQDSEIMRINRPLFRRMLEEYPDIAGIVEARITENLSGLSGALAGIARRFE